MNNGRADSTSAPAPVERPDETGHTELEQHAERLKERVYVTFTALAVLIALGTHAHEETPGKAALTLFITVAGVLMASFCADLVAHTVVHQGLPHRAELRHLLRVTGGALSAVTVPLLLIGAAGLGWMHLDAALRVGQIVLVVTLGLLAWIALRRVKLPLWQRLLMVVALIAIGALAVGLEIAAHLF